MTKHESHDITGTVFPAHNGEIRARCGFLCSSCAAYKKNVASEDDKKKVSDGWQKLYRLDIPPSVMCCDGCLEPDENHPHRIGMNCPIRTCVLNKGITHCGECGTFPCDLIEKHMASVENAVPRAREIMTGDEFHQYVDPYLCREFMSAGKR
ncbi:MAG: DUF3795 domain-containing protein [Methanoregula sp.]|jgi:hypothetical protein